MNAADRLDSIDFRLERMIALSERQGERFDQLGDRLNKIAATAERQAQTAERAERPAS